MEHLRFKSEREEREWAMEGKLCPKLIVVLADLVERRWTLLKQESVVTCIFRSFAENRGIGGTSNTHCEWRAVDIRVDPTQLFVEMAIRVALNERWPTGVAKMPRIPPLDHGTALHYHVQVTRDEGRARLSTRKETT